MHKLALLAITLLLAFSTFRYLPRWVNRNNRSFSIREEAMALDHPNLEQAQAFSARLGGRRAAIWLLGKANGLGREDIENQADLVDLIVEQGLSVYLSPAELQKVITMGSFQCLVFTVDGRYEDVLRQADKILAIAPKSVDGLVWKGYALGLLKQDPEQAARYLETAVSLYPNSVFALTYTAQYYFYLSPGRSLREKAWPILERALQIDPQDELALKMTTEYLFDEGKCQAALPMAQKAAKLFPAQAGPWERLGNVYWCMGEKDLARSYYQEAINIDPNYDPNLQDRMTTP
jgi:tetratricopeptide (TPR) repeat protein